MSTEKTSEQLSTLDGSSTSNGKKPNGPARELTFSSKRAPVIMERALSDLVIKDKKTAQDVIARGFPELAEPINRQIAEVEYQMLPQLRSQREMQLVTYDDLEKQILAHLDGIVRSGFQGLEEKGAATKVSLKSRHDRTSRNIAQKATSLLMAVARASYDAGLAARYMSPESIAAEQLAKITGRAD